MEERALRRRDEATTASGQNASALTRAACLGTSRSGRADSHCRGPAPGAGGGPAARSGGRAARRTRSARVLAEHVVSEVAVPPFDGSAMDGFALPAGARGRLEVVGESRAGHPWTEPLQAGTAVRISTGAAVPQGTAAVAPVEDVTEERRARWRSPPTPDGANVRLRGEDVQPGDRFCRAAPSCRPRPSGCSPAWASRPPRCARRPLVAILATGDELTEPGAAVARRVRSGARIRVALAGQVVRAGAVVERTRDACPTMPRGHPRGHRRRPRTAPTCVCVSGGVSVGAHDHVKGALRDLGVEESFWGVALRPGKPTWFGTPRRRRAAACWPSGCRATRCRRWSPSGCSSCPRCARCRAPIRARPEPRRCWTSRWSATRAATRLCAAG